MLVENYRPGVLAKMGFDEARLRALNPALVVTSVNGYGSSGPYVERPAFDFIAQAMSGFMSVTGPPGEPMRAGPPISDLVAGLYAAFGTVSALLARERGTTAGGQRLEASLMNGLISLLAYSSAAYLATGQLPERTGNDHPVVYPYGLFHAQDGEVAIAPSTPAIVRAPDAGARARAPARAARVRHQRRPHGQPRAPQGADQRADRPAPRSSQLDRAPQPRGRALRPGHDARGRVRRPAGPRPGDGHRGRPPGPRPRSA